MLGQTTAAPTAAAPVAAVQAREPSPPAAAAVEPAAARSAPVTASPPKQITPEPSFNFLQVCNVFFFSVLDFYV